MANVIQDGGTEGIKVIRHESPIAPGGGIYRAYCGISVEQGVRKYWERMGEYPGVVYVNPDIGAIWIQLLKKEERT